MKSHRALLTLAVVATGLLLAVAVVTWPVAASAPAGTQRFAAPDGTGTACTQDLPCSLQTALAQSVNGDAIYLAGGNYTGAQNPLLDINKSVAIYGGWNGGANNPGLVRWPEMFPTTLNGEAARRVIQVNGAYSVTLDGLLIAGGLASDGGGVHVSGGAQVTVRHSVIALSFAVPGEGGGMRVDGASTVLIEESGFVSNTAMTAGSALSVSAGSRVTLRDSIVSRGTAAGGVSIRLNGVSASLDHVTVVDNPGSDGMYASGTALTLTNSIVASNTRGVRVDGGGTTVLGYNDVWGNSGGNYVGVADPTGTNGNLSADPLFVQGPYVPYFLSQVAAGQPANSPAVDAGSAPATTLPYYEYLTTRTDSGRDTGMADLGYHHRRYYTINLPLTFWY